MDLFRTVYDKPSTNLSFLPFDLVPVITDIYRRVELCNHVKRLANDLGETGTELIRGLGANPQDAQATEAVSTGIPQFVRYLGIYIQNMEALVVRCDVGVKELSKIAKIDETKVYEVNMVSPDGIKFESRG